MQLYTSTNNKLKHIKEKPFKLERHLQNVFESNLTQLLGITLLKSEYKIKDRRFDSLAFDEKNNSFIIIEYKKESNTALSDQGITYLSLLLDNRDTFLVEVNERLKKNLKRNQVNWDATRVIFVAPAFTDMQKSAVDILKGIELIEVKQYENDLWSVDFHQKSKRAQNPNLFEAEDSSSTFAKVQREIKEYTEEEHLQKASEDIKELYEDYKEMVLSINPEITIIPTQCYIGFKKDSNITDVELQKNKMKVYLNARWGQLDDYKHLFENISHKGHWANGDYRIEINNADNLDYIRTLIKQVISLEG